MTRKIEIEGKSRQNAENKQTFGIFLAYFRNHYFKKYLIFQSCFESVNFTKFLFNRRIKPFHVNFVGVLGTRFKECWTMSVPNIRNPPNPNGNFALIVSSVFPIRNLCKTMPTNAKAAEFVNFVETISRSSKLFMDIWKNITWKNSKRSGFTTVRFAKNHSRPAFGWWNTWNPLIRISFSIPFAILSVSRHFTLGHKPTFCPELMFLKYEFCEKWDFENVNFVKNRLWNCEFCEIWDFYNVNFVNNEILKMWII